MTEQSQASAEEKKPPFLVPTFIYRQLQLLKDIGFKRYIKSSGKWFLLGIFLFYLVRDVTLYIIIPYLVYSGIIGSTGPTP